MREPRCLDRGGFVRVECGLRRVGGMDDGYWRVFGGIVAVSTWFRGHTGSVTGMYYCAFHIELRSRTLLLRKQDPCLAAQI